MKEITTSPRRVQPLFYATHVLENRERVLDFYRERKFNEAVMTLTQLYTLLEGAVKFILPEGGRPINWKDQEDCLLKELYAEGSKRLPFPACCFEYHTTPQIDTHGKTHAKVINTATNEKRIIEIDGCDVPRRVVLAFEFRKEIIERLSLVSGFARSPDLIKFLENSTETPITIWPFNYYEGEWAPSWCGILFRDDLEYRIPMLMEIAQLISLKPNISLADIAIVDTQDELTAVLETIVALSCSNVTTSEIPAPKFLNKKREAKGKQPLFSYYVLEIPGDNYEDRHDGGGTHTSPRQHLRRGHVRHLSTKNVWVNSCLVGDPTKGRIDKDYAVRI